MGEPRLLKLRDVASRANISMATLYQLIRKGLGPTVINMDPTRKRPFLRVDSKDLEEWLNQRRT